MVSGPSSHLYTESGDQYHEDNLSTSSTQLDTFSNYTANTDTPMSRLSRYGFKMRSSSSFPSILNLYSEPISEETVGYTWLCYSYFTNVALLLKCLF